ncbi:hypothetical protein E4M00_03400 [Leifsonia flava]|uniref:Uncharacterized protein n=1 Tax=Orlajensenia leifsoniae TaxID=2561933 RepID=A0A4Y9R887_9MICO|nr:hypothetical protein E4M00_03400 [Leifsonia flava]
MSVTSSRAPSFCVDVDPAATGEYVPAPWVPEGTEYPTTSKATATGLVACTVIFDCPPRTTRTGADAGMPVGAMNAGAARHAWAAVEPAQTEMADAAVARAAVTDSQTAVAPLGTEGRAEVAVPPAASEVPERTRCGATAWYSEPEGVAASAGVAARGVRIRAERARKAVASVMGANKGRRRVVRKRIKGGL